MNQYYRIEKILNSYGQKVCLKDGDWISSPFGAIVQPTWRKNKTKFEKTATELGFCGKDYYLFIGPFCHNITNISNDAVLILNDKKFCFCQKEAVVIGEKVQFYYGVLKRIWEDEDDIFK